MQQIVDLIRYSISNNHLKSYVYSYPSKRSYKIYIISTLRKYGVPVIVGQFQYISIYHFADTGVPIVRYF